MKAKQLILLIVLFAPITFYLLFKENIKPYWEEFDIVFTISSYSLSIVLALYTLNLKFHFAVNKFFSLFRQDHTYWFFSYSCQTKNVVSQESLLENFKGKDFTINKTEKDFIEFIYKDSHLLRLQINHFENETIHLFTNKLIVPSKRVKSTINELVEVVENLENSIKGVKTETKKFDLTIEYPNHSPFYSYWVKKLPEQSIYNFNFKIKVLSNENSVQVNMNQIIISSNSLNKLFDTTKDYLSLQIEI